MAKVYFQNFKVIPFIKAEDASKHLELLKSIDDEGISVSKIKNNFLDPSSQSAKDVFVITKINHRGHLVVHDKDGAFVFSTENPESDLEKYFEKVNFDEDPKPNRSRQRP